MTTLKWTKVDNYHIRAGGYTITKFIINNAEVYTAYYLPNTMLGSFKSLQDAKNRISEHINEINKTV